MRTLPIVASTALVLLAPGCRGKGSDNPAWSPICRRNCVAYWSDRSHCWSTSTKSLSPR